VRVKGTSSHPVVSKCIQFSYSVGYSAALPSLCCQLSPKRTVLYDKLPRILLAITEMLLAVIEVFTLRNWSRIKSCL
jgi:hypothetical protein